MIDSLPKPLNNNVKRGQCDTNFFIAWEFSSRKWSTHAAKHWIRGNFISSKVRRGNMVVKAAQKNHILTHRLCVFWFWFSFETFTELPNPFPSNVQLHSMTWVLLVAGIKPIGGWGLVYIRRWNGGLHPAPCYLDKLMNHCISMPT